MSDPVVDAATMRADDARLRRKRRSRVSYAEADCIIEGRLASDGEVTEWCNQTNPRWRIMQGSAERCLDLVENESIDCVVTSPPYFWLRDYGVQGQIGLEDSVAGYVQSIAGVMDKVRLKLKREGVMFLNLGDTYYSGKGQPCGPDRKSSKRRFGLRAVDKSGGLGIGLKPKSTIGVPWRVAIEMCRRDWVLRSPIIWHRENCLLEPSARDRPSRTYETVFMFVKSRNYYFNRTHLPEKDWAQDVWRIPPVRGNHSSIDTAPFPDNLVERCLAIGCKQGGAVLDPFCGSGTTVRVAVRSGRPATGIDLNREFCEYAAKSLMGNSCAGTKAHAERIGGATCT